MKAMRAGEAAERLAVSKPTVLKLLKKGKLPGCRTEGNHWRISAEAVEKFLLGEGNVNEPSRPA